MRARRWTVVSLTVLMAITGCGSTIDGRAVSAPDAAGAGPAGSASPTTSGSSTKDGGAARQKLALDQTDAPPGYVKGTLDAQMALARNKDVQPSDPPGCPVPVFLTEKSVPDGYFAEWETSANKNTNYVEFITAATDVPAPSSIAALVAPCATYVVMEKDPRFRSTITITPMTVPTSPATESFGFMLKVLTYSTISGPGDSGALTGYSYNYYGVIGGTAVSLTARGAPRTQYDISLFNKLWARATAKVAAG